MQQSGRVKVITEDRNDSDLRRLLTLATGSGLPLQGLILKGTWTEARKRITAKNSKGQEYVLKK